MKKSQQKIRVDLDDPAIEEAVLKLTPIFHMFGWTWHDDEHPPTANRIRETIEHLILDVTENNYQFASTGRITVTRMRDGDYYSLDISLDLSTLYDERDK